MDTNKQEEQENQPDADLTPFRIWLQVEEIEEGVPITWCDHQVHPSDIEYECVTRKGVVHSDDIRYWSIAAGGETARERLASYAHEAWSGWMRYLFSRCLEHPDGLLIPGELVNRWKRQSETKYMYLPENEKASDLKEADVMLDIIMTTIFSKPMPEPARD